VGTNLGLTPTPPDVFAQALYEESATKKHALGTMRLTEDGRIFIYCKAGSSNLAAAHLCTYLTTFTSEDTVTVAHASGTTTVTVTASGVSADDFADGYLFVDEGTGIGEIYRIKSNTATDGSGLIQVTLYDELKTAWSTSDTDVTLVKNPYGGLVVNPVDAQQRPVVVTQRPVTANYYFWGLAKGIGTIKMDVASAAGQTKSEKLIYCSTNHAGQGMLIANPDTSSSTDLVGRHVVGWIIEEADIGDDKATLAFIDLL